MSILEGHVVQDLSDRDVEVNMECNMSLQNAK
jgi:hypothetical protein